MADDLRARIAEALCPPHHRVGSMSSNGPISPLRPCQLHQAQAETVAAIVQPELADDAWGSVWLYGSWHTITRQMTTPEREHAADAVERWNRRLNAADPDLGPLDGLRWWREPQPAPEPGPACTCGNPTGPWRWQHSSSCPLGPKHPPLLCSRSHDHVRHLWMLGRMAYSCPGVTNTTTEETRS